MKKLILALFLIVSCSTSKNIESPVDAPSENHAPKTVFISKSKLEWLTEAARISNCVIGKKEFLDEVESFKGYTYTDKTPDQIVYVLKNPSTAYLNSYKTTNPFSSVVATTYLGDKENIYFNLRKNPRTKKAHVNTAIHEALHLWGFSHGDNYAKGKENSVNYKVGEIAEKYVDDCADVIITSGLN